jgi:hypothetical protein
MKEVSSLMVICALVSGAAAHADPSRYEHAVTSADILSTHEEQPDISDARIDQHGESLPGTGTITIDGHSWHFSFSEGPTDRCKTGTPGNRNGIVAWGTEVNGDGSSLEKPARLFLNVYPEDWQPKGKQAHEIRIEGPLAGDDWTTAGPSVVESNPQAPELAEARVTEWRMDGTRTWGDVTVYLKRSLDDTQSGGSLVVESGTFDIHCP